MEREETKLARQTGEDGKKSDKIEIQGRLDPCWCSEGSPECSNSQYGASLQHRIQKEGGDGASQEGPQLLGSQTSTGRNSRISLIPHFSPSLFLPHSLPALFYKTASFNFKSLLPKPSSLLPSKPKSTPIIRDPLSLVSSELSSLRSNVTSLLGSGHPALDTIAKYYFQAEGKHVRPLIVLLMAKATNGLSPTWSSRNLGESGDRDFSGNNESGKQTEKDCGIDEPLSPREVLNDFNPHMESVEGVQGQERSSFTSASTITSSPETIATTYEIGSYPILPTQRRLAEITEMIHVASLLHDDVIDASSVRRSAPSAPAAFGNKLSILGGDFLLGRASVALARLRDNEVVELLATVIANLVEGEVMQLKSQSNLNSKQNKSIFSNFWNVGNKEILGRSNVEESRNENGNSRLSIKLSNSPFAPTPELFENYLQKTYLKTAALIGKSARASVILGGNGSDSSSLSSIGTEDLSRKIRDSAYAYGRNLGIAFQLVDDLLDFKSTSLAFGKPSGGADLRLGLATAPVLYAWEEMEEKGMKEMKEMVERKFETKGDVEKVSC